MSDTELFIPFKVLVIEHDDQTRQFIMGRLLKKGFEVNGEKNAHNAIKTAQGFKPELMLVSMEMPRLDGSYLIRRFKKDEGFTKIPLVIMAFEMDKRVKEAMNIYEIKDILRKPVSSVNLMPLIEKYYKLKVIAEVLKG